MLTLDRMVSNVKTRPAWKKTFERYAVRYNHDFNQIRFYVPEYGNLYYWMAPFCRIDPMGGTDRYLSKPIVEKKLTGNAKAVVITTGISSAWKKKETIYELYPDRCECYARVEGRGIIDRVYFGLAQIGDQAVGSVPGFDYYWPGCPNFLAKRHFAPFEYFSLNVGLETSWWGPALNGGPLFYAFMKDGLRSAFSAGVLARPGENQFQCFDFNYKPAEVLATHDHIVNTQSFSLGYYGAVKVAGVWESPRLVFQFGNDKWDCLKQYCELLERRGAIPRIKHHPGADWWKKPIFCGWHEQAALARERNLKSRRPLTEIELTKYILPECTQPNHMRWINILRRQRVPIGTIIVDARWQRHYGAFEVDRKLWPDMRGFIEFCHRHGQRVLLWIKAWDCDGLDRDECILHKGKPVAADPTAPAYQRRLQEGLRFMLSPDKGCLNADGLKIDGTCSVPIGYGIATIGKLYGYELQHYYIGLYYKFTKLAKPDALVSVYIANPYFRDVCDMVRTGDLYSVHGRPLDTQVERAAVIRTAMKDKLIDTDGNFHFSLAEDLTEELSEQIKLGIPTLYNAEKVDRHRVFAPIVIQKITQKEYQNIRRLLNKYLATIR